MSKSIEINDLIELVLGNIEWYGESNHDHKVNERLEDYFKLIDYLFDKLTDLIKVRFQYQGSAQMLGNKAYEYLESLKDDIQTYIELYAKKEEETK
jgi:hypothetical protein